MKDAETIPANGAEEVRAGDLSAEERRELRELLARHFDGVSEEQFERDLADKDWVLRIREGGVLVGFTTLAVRELSFAGEVLTVVFSGDTIMEPAAWGSPSLARGWIRLVRRACAEREGKRCYWLLLSSGFRTYRFLPVFWREFWPAAGVETPAEARALRDAAARWHYGDDYDPRTGLVRFSQPQRLRGELAEVPPARLDDPHVAFFLGQNPGWERGDELVCLVDLDEKNLTAAGRRVSREGAR